MIVVVPLHERVLHRVRSQQQCLVTGATWCADRGLIAPEETRSDQSVQPSQNMQSMLLVYGVELTELSGVRVDSTFVERMASYLICSQEAEVHCCSSSEQLQLAAYFQGQENISTLPSAEEEVTKRDSEPLPRLDPRARLENILTTRGEPPRLHGQGHVVLPHKASFELVLVVEVPKEDPAVVQEQEQKDIALISGAEEAAQKVADQDSEPEVVVLELDLDLCSEYIFQVSHVALVSEKRANPQRNQCWRTSVVWSDLQVQLEMAQ